MTAASPSEVLGPSDHNRPLPASAASNTQQDSYFHDAPAIR